MSARSTREVTYSVMASDGHESIEDASVRLDDFMRRQGATPVGERSREYLPASRLTPLGGWYLSRKGQRPSDPPVFPRMRLWGRRSVLVGAGQLSDDGGQQ